MAFHEVILSDYTSHPKAMSIVGLAQVRLGPAAELLAAPRGDALRSGAWPLGGAPQAPPASAVA